MVTIKGRLKGNWGRKFEAKFSTFHPSAKMRGGTDEMSESVFFCARPRTQPLKYFLIGGTPRSGRLVGAAKIERTAAKYKAFNYHQVA